MYLRTCIIKSIFWISIIHFLIFKNVTYGYPKIDFIISLNTCLDILKSIFGYPKIMLNFGYPFFDFRISNNPFLDIQYSLDLRIFYDIQKRNLEYPLMNYGYP